MEMNPAQLPTDNRGGDYRTADYELPCGQTVDAVWDDLRADRVTAHGLDCPHCTTTRAGLSQLAEATKLLVEDQTELPANLVDSIMTAVRADLRLARTIQLPPELPTATGYVDISFHALAAVLRYVVDGVDGIRAHECRIDPAADQSGAPGTIRVWMSVSLRFGSGRVAALAEARRRVASALPQRIGLQLDSLDFEVADVWIDERYPGGRS
ncbi:hypothetical protein GCM10009630_10140 [Kribbella jejuensis]|uniref:Asp23/Gls24 family envelope stress response protein n=1 Tax=Kribbella jejuensis TaxID=236068 RepID=A0A542EAE1_9ACTN|nr:Asp23/Gls24 family envelope stress response protein [Kribbella jejuensis]TQJ12236.1 hypothetical protein FB475_5171 [Kribbella jejuensis]